MRGDAMITRYRERVGAIGVEEAHNGNLVSYSDFELLQERCFQLEAQGGVDRRTARVMRAYTVKLEATLRMVDGIRHRLKVGHDCVDELKAPCMVIYE